jgi:fimbrial chaperone protein
MRFGLALLSLLLAAPALGAPPSVSMDVAPSTLELKPGAAELFYVTNHGDEPVTVELEGFDWSQSDNRDVLVPAKDFIASPPMADIAPGKRQLVRVMALGHGNDEVAYRLIVSQLPPALSADSNNVHILLRFGVPVFVNQQSAPAPRLEWQATRNGDVLDVAVHNSGNRAVKLAGVQLKTAAGAIIEPTKRDFFYVLANATRTVHFRVPAQAPAWQLIARDLRSDTAITANIAPDR